MEYLIIILVIAIALAPLSHFVPSKRQRAVAGMRETAAIKGLFVEFRQLPARSGAPGTGTDRANDGVIYYGKRLPPPRGSGPRRGSWLQGQDGWCSVKGGDKAPEILQRLPPQVLAASVDEGSCGIYWRESGGTEELAIIIDTIGLWADSLQPVRG